MTELRIPWTVLLAAAAFAVGVGAMMLVLGVDTVSFWAGSIALAIGLLTPIVARIVGRRIRFGRRPAPRVVEAGKRAVPVSASTAQMNAVELRDELRTVEELYGADDPRIMDMRHLVGALLYVQGHAREALELAGQNLVHRVRVEGPHHQHTLDTRRQLAAMSRGGSMTLQELL